MQTVDFQYFRNISVFKQIIRKKTINKSKKAIGFRDIQKYNHIKIGKTKIVTIAVAAYFCFTMLAESAMIIILLRYLPMFESFFFLFNEQFWNKGK